MCCNRPRPCRVGPLPSSGASVAGQGRQSDERGSAHQRLPQRRTQRHPRNQPGCACNPGTLARIKHRGPLHEERNAPRVRSLAPTQAGGSGGVVADIAKLSVGREEYYTRELATDHEQGMTAEQAKQGLDGL